MVNSGLSDWDFVIFSRVAFQDRRQRGRQAPIQYYVQGPSRARRRDSIDRRRNENLRARFTPVDVGVDRLAVKPADMPMCEILALVQGSDGHRCEHLSLLRFDWFIVERETMKCTEERD